MKLRNYGLILMMGAGCLTACASESQDPVAARAELAAEADGFEFEDIMTREACVPDLDTLVTPLVVAEQAFTGRHGKGGHKSPTGIPGDNMDDAHSGKVDCYFDGDSGQGNDRDGCEPPAGCDEHGCCAVAEKDDDDAHDDDDESCDDDGEEDDDACGEDCEEAGSSDASGSDGEPTCTDCADGEPTDPTDPTDPPPIFAF